MLIIIPYQIGIGFAIRRLIGVFYEMAVRLTGDPSLVHFAFARVGSGRSDALPPDFANIVEFDSVTPNRSDVDRLSRYIREHRIQSIFALDLAVEAPYLSALRGAGVSRIVSYQGAPMSSVNRGAKLALKRVEVALVRRARPDYFIFESEAMRELGVRGRGLRRSATGVVHTGVDAAVFRPAAASPDLVYSQFAIPRNRRIVTYMGHLDERKGVHVLMRAAARVVTEMRRTDIHFLFLGNREGEPERFNAETSQATEYITFGGYQPEIPSLLAGCYAGCIPSSGWDSFPMSSLEMQACGLPVVVSDLQGVPETIADQETGIVVPTGDPARLAEAIARLVDEPERRDRMGSAARRRIEASLTRTHQMENLVGVLGPVLMR